MILGLKGEAKLKKRDEVTWDSLVAYVKSEVPDTVKSLYGHTTKQIPENKGELRGPTTLITFISTTPTPKGSKLKPMPSPDPTKPMNESSIRLTWPFTETQAKAAQEIWAKSMGKDLIEKNRLGMEFVLIPLGKFVMGSPSEEKGRKNDENQVEVALESPFWLGKTEVTQDQWQKLMGTTPWKKEGEPIIKETLNNPATYINWDSAQEFIKRLGKSDNWAYRLPIEEEWEWSCRAGTASPWSFGETESDLHRYGWYGALDGGTAFNEKYAHAVGKKQANPFGLCDMHGNVWEWCAPVKLEGSQKDPQGKPASGGLDCYLRGGSCYDKPHLTRSASRLRGTRDVQYNVTGFRVLRTP